MNGCRWLVYQKILGAGRCSGSQWVTTRLTCWLLIGLSALLVACQPSVITNAAAGLPTSEPEVAAMVTEEPAVARPAVVYTVAAPEERGDPFQSDGASPAIPTAWPTVTPEEALSLATATAPWPTMTPTGTAAASETPPPPPTFTPPALPNTPEWEHYWFWRPVPDGGAVWTDKAYPYGSTRGGTLRPHHGVEFNVPAGTPVLAVASGTVVVAGDDGDVAYGPTPNFYGNLVVIEHDFQLNGQPVYSLYGHLSEISVVPGEVVAVRAQIALSGASGIADGAHLHFEVRVGENSYKATRNPLLWLYPFPDRGSIAGMVVWPDGQPVREAPVTARRIDAPANYAATTTYAGDSVNADEGWQENFVLDDVAAGYYEVVVRVGDTRYKSTVWVYPYQTSFVTITLDGSQ